MNIKWYIYIMKICFTPILSASTCCPYFFFYYLACLGTVCRYLSTHCPPDCPPYKNISAPIACKITVSGEHPRQNMYEQNFRFVLYIVEAVMLHKLPARLCALCHGWKSKASEQAPTAKKIITLLTEMCYSG